MPRGQKRTPSHGGGHSCEADACQQDITENFAPAREFLHSVQSFMRECYENGPPHKAELNMVKSSIMNLLKARQSTTAAKARASCLIKLPSGNEPRTAMALPPGNLDITSKMLTRCTASRLTGGEFVMKLSHELCRLMGPKGHRTMKSRLEHWDDMMGLTWAAPPASTPPPSPPMTDESTESPLGIIEHNRKEKDQLKATKELESVPKEELKAFWNEYGSLVGLDTAKKAIAVFGSFKQAVPWVEHVLVSQRRAAMELNFMCPDTRNPNELETAPETESLAQSESMKINLMPSGPPPTLWEELVLRAAQTFGNNDGSCESEENIQKLQEIFGRELPSGLARQAVQNCPDVETAIRWIQPMFDGYFYGKENVLSDSESDVDMDDGIETWGSHEDMVDDNKEDTTMMDADDERPVRLRVRNGRTAHIRLRTAAGLETLVTECQGVSREEWEAFRPKLVCCMGNLAKDLRLLPGQPRDSGRTSTDESDSEDSESESDENDGEDRHVARPSPSKGLPELKPINLNEVLPFVSALPHDIWEKYRSAAENMHSSGKFLSMSPKQRLHKLVKAIYQPEETICIPDKDWTRLGAAVRIVEKLTVATGDRNRDEEPHMDEVKDWVRNKMRDIAMLARLDDEESD